mgnify:FL=1
MKIFANANIWKKLVIVFLAVLCLAFVAPKNVEAADDHIGGTLMKPICSFVVWFGDGVTNVLHKVLIKQDTTIITVDTNSTLKKIGKILGTIFVSLAVGAFVIGTGGVGLAAIAGGLSAVAYTTLGSLFVLGTFARHICWSKCL